VQTNFVGTFSTQAAAEAQMRRLKLVHGRWQHHPERYKDDGDEFTAEHDFRIIKTVMNQGTDRIQELIDGEFPEEADGRGTYSEEDEENEEGEDEDPRPRARGRQSPFFLPEDHQLSRIPFANAFISRAVPKNLEAMTK
jgi:hypothetical protein